MVLSFRAMGVALAVASVSIIAAAQPTTVAGAPSVSTVDGRYQQGFRDALNRIPQRVKAGKDARYDDGYRAGVAQRNVLAERGPDYELGYRDGFDRRSPRGKSGQNQAYRAGYRDGESWWRTGGATPGNADYQAGYRDGKDNRPSRYDERTNPSYAQGYRAGQQSRQPSWLDKGLPNPTDR